MRIQRLICVYCDKDLPARAANASEPHVKYVFDGCSCQKRKGGKKCPKPEVKSSIPTSV
jgi:hypothetical protein